ncbi:MAG TPA: hypothetical protein ENO09_02680 [bacterium]|nr:hypothetical protein [bacterium]
MMKEQMDNTLETLAQQRDELKLKLHLLGMEARDEWEANEKLWQQVQSAAEDIRNSAGEALDDTWVRFNTFSLELSEKYAKLAPVEDDLKVKINHTLEAGMDELRVVRDELALKAHLLGMEARQQWEETEPLWAHLSAKLDQIKHESGEALDKLASAASELKQDLAERYQRLKKDD